MKWWKSTQSTSCKLKSDMFGQKFTNTQAPFHVRRKYPKAIHKLSFLRGILLRAKIEVQCWCIEIAGIYDETSE
ncbi:uncharacterized protein PHALS_15259 [Plasmopara halstedii]|uniref:Uncharacterized protein n=1 Tax=Plasmopara halstedii TaxID=4781 RepID=A0A0P1ARX2_PLAHL|nr:uncharacterized protein PHALS_15259 [Plasmopara halstedii]CEG44446.1 hypothetical protein PHALS_15259 [Plasmopara halstedii]|eukprot:XP_024580815.1 hypothetical protein PHALS_15259 [Plasmopara halstedii]